MRLDLNRMENTALEAKRGNRMIPTHPDVALALVERIRWLHKIVDSMMSEHEVTTERNGMKTCITCTYITGEPAKYPCSTRYPQELWLGWLLDPNYQMPDIHWGQQ